MYSFTMQVVKRVIDSPERMIEVIREYGIIPFFRCGVTGWSIEEMTAPGCWFTDEEEGGTLGPWDWKIFSVQSGDIAYGKFLWGGKAAFATVDVYRELLNWRRAQPKYAPSEDQQRILDYVAEHGSIGVAEVRKLLGIKKAAADNLLARLQMQTRLVTGDIIRVYRGVDLTYSGWQRSSFCAPESLFQDLDFPFPGFKPVSLKSSLTPQESLEYVKENVRRICGDVPEKLLSKLLE